MKNKAVLQGTFWYWRVAPAAMALAVALLLIGLANSAAAAPIIAKDGKVSACYRVGAKQKGAVRLVPKRMHCRRGERKVRWAATGPAGPQGANGQAGPNGAAGPRGATGATGAAGLESQITALTTKVETLESTLKGVTNESLTKALATVNGITNAQLQEAIGAVADVNALCTQATALTQQVNLVGTALEDTALGGVIPLGLSLLVPGLPAQLPAFSC